MYCCHCNHFKQRHRVLIIELLQATVHDWFSNLFPIHIICTEIEYVPENLTTEFSRRKSEYMTRARILTTPFTIFAARKSLSGSFCMESSYITQILTGEFAYFKLKFMNL